MKVIAFDSSPKKDGNTTPKRDFIKKKFINLMTIAVKLFKASDKLPIICIFGHNDFKLVTPIQEDYEEKHQRISLNRE